MLDATAYRANETNAKRAIADWRLSNVNDPYIFQNQGFPVRADSFLDLAQILDTMQEGRFDYYMRELGGLTEEDLGCFVDVCVDYIDFYRSVFQRDRVIVPLSTLISHFVIYRKLLGYKENFSSLLEIGPGCGYLSFFLRNHASLADYTQIESTESFYLLQSHINSHVFGLRFAEHALSRAALFDHGAYIPKLKWHNEFHYEEQKIINVAGEAICNHYPWWRIAEVSSRRYEIVTSNANLNEFSREALFQYLSLIRDVLAEDGVIIAQCLGGGKPTYDSVFADMKSAGFVPIALMAGDCMPGNFYVVSNGVFVGEKHPLFPKYAGLAPQFPMFDGNLDFLNMIYFQNLVRPKSKRVFTASEILKKIQDRLEVRARLGRDFNASELAAKVLSSAHTRDTSRMRRIAVLEGFRDKASASQDPQTQWLTAEVEALRRGLADMKTSTSWKVTAPLRAVGGLLRRLRS